MIRYKVIYAAAGLILGIGIGLGIAWAAGSPFQKTALVSPDETVTITTEQIPESNGETDELLSESNTPVIVKTPGTSPSTGASQTSSPQPTQTVATPKPTQTPKPTVKPTNTPAPTRTPAPTPTPTPQPTPAFTYTVYNKDGVAPAGYTIVFVKITPNGSYHVTYNGETITSTQTGSGYITYYKTVEKLENGNYSSKVSVSAG